MDYTDKIEDLKNEEDLSEDQQISLDRFIFDAMDLVTKKEQEGIDYNYGHKRKIPPEPEGVKSYDSTTEYVEDYETSSNDSNALEIDDTVEEYYDTTSNLLEVSTRSYSESSKDLNKSKKIKESLVLKKEVNVKKQNITKSFKKTKSINKKKKF